MPGSGHTAVLAGGVVAVVSFHFTAQERTSSRAYTMTLLR